MLTVSGTQPLRSDSLPFHVQRPPTFKQVVFAHLFSGHRRSGDVQTWLEQAGAVALSIDVIFDLEMGDLSRPETFAFFASALRSNILKGIIAGPPCETWSRARGTVLPDGKLGPRKVRSQQRPSGLLNLTKAEDRQVRFGTRLLGIAIGLMVIALITGASGILEHSAEEADDVWQVSIWRTLIVRFLLRMQGCRKVRVCQSHFGSPAVKPTDLLLFNVTSCAEETLLKGRKYPLPKKAAIGKLEDGSWATTRLKEYPEHFCHLLSQLLLDSQPAPFKAASIPEDFLRACSELTQGFDDKAAMGADYCRKEVCTLIHN